MKILDDREKKDFECDECNMPLTGRQAVLIGEKSYGFFHDTCQAMVCRVCLERAIMKLDHDY